MAGDLPVPQAQTSIGTPDADAPVGGAQGRFQQAGARFVEAPVHRPLAVLRGRLDDGQLFQFGLALPARLKVAFDGAPPGFHGLFVRDVLGQVSPEPDEVVGAVSTAIEVGYRSIDTARLYGNDPNDGVGGTGAFFLLLDEPEVYGLPPDPVVTTKDLPHMFNRATTAAAALLVGAAVSFLGRRG